MRTRDRRIGQVMRAIEVAPVRRHLLREAYEWFTSFGELPEDNELVAFEVVQQALRGGEERPLQDEKLVARDARKAGRAHQGRKALETGTWPPSVRSMLFEEALFGHPKIRDLARAQIGVEVAYGGDVESPGFGARHGMPMYGSIAIHMSGWRQRLVRPPYEFQATRLLTRLDNLCGRIPNDDDSWLDAMAEAIVRFKMTGELPADDQMAEMVLANVELDQLIAHKAGRDVAKVMAVFNEIAWNEGDVMEAALKRLCEMARAGKVR
jgi:hypothetical protein